MSEHATDRPIWISAVTRQEIMPSLERQLREAGKDALANFVKHWMREWDAAGLEGQVQHLPCRAVHAPEPS